MTSPSEGAVPRLQVAPDLEIARVLTGLWQVADMERGGATLDPETAAAAMDPYVAAGLTTFDMADHYGSAELIAGHHRATRGGATQMLTKWVPKPGPTTREDVVAAVDRAAERLGTERIDLLQFHTWTYDDPVWLDQLHQLNDLRRAGRIGALGLTNVDTAHWRLALDDGLPLVTNQVSFSLLDRRAAHGLTDLALERDVHVLAYGTLAGGLLTDRWLGRDEPTWDDDATPWSLNKYRRFVEAIGGWDAYQGVLHAARAVADRHDASIANVATRFVLDTPGVAGVIIGARLGTSEHVADTLRGLELALSDADRSILENAIAGLDPVPGDCGDEYRREPFLTASGDLRHHLDALPAPYPVATDARGVRRVRTGTEWEARAGYARARRDGRAIRISGTTAHHGTRLVAPSSAASQTHFVLDKVAGVLRSLGAGLEDVVRTRIHVADPADVAAVADAHGARLGAAEPANTLVASGLIGEDVRVEIEVDALAPDGA